MTLPGEGFAKWDARPSMWLVNLARHPYGGIGAFLGCWAGGLVISVVMPGWIVLELLSQGDLGWIDGWAKWRPIMVAHLMTGLAVGLAYYIHTVGEAARRIVDEWAHDHGR